MYMNAGNAGLCTYSSQFPAITILLLQLELLNITLLSKLTGFCTDTEQKSSKYHRDELTYFTFAGALCGGGWG